MKILMISKFIQEDTNPAYLRNQGIKMIFENAGHQVKELYLGKKMGRIKIFSYLNKILTLMFMPRILGKIFISHGEYDVFYINSMNIAGFKYIKKYIKKKRKIVFVDVDEYPVLDAHNNIKVFLWQKRIIKIVEKIITRPFIVICPSEYLFNYFKHKGIDVYLVPIFSSIIDKSINITHLNKKKNFAYIGNPGYKEDLKVIFDSFSLLSPDILETIQLTVVGVSLSSLIEKGIISLKNKEFLLSFTNFKGRQSRSEINDLYRKIDFTIFIRFNNRTNNAGFPTKFSESFAQGVPVIANITSDIGKYLVDGKNGFVIKHVTENNIGDIIKRVCAMTQEEMQEFKNSTLDTAHTHFNVSNFKASFLERLDHDK